MTGSDFLDRFIDNCRVGSPLMEFLARSRREVVVTIVGALVGAGPRPPNSEPARCLYSRGCAGSGGRAWPW